MIHYWQLSEDATSFLESFRTQPNVRIARIDSILWLQFPHSLLLQLPSLKALPALKRYHALPHEPYLFSHNSALPHGSAPTGPWESLQTFLKLELPVPSLPATPNSIHRLSLSLVPTPDTFEPIPATLLLLATSTWIDYALQAPEYRLAPLQIASSSTGQTSVLGTPLPSLAGARYYEIERIYFPVGLTWSPQIPFATLKQILRPQPNERLLWRSDTGLSKIIDEQWINASRAGACAMRQDNGIDPQTFS